MISRIKTLIFGLCFAILISSPVVAQTSTTTIQKQTVATTAYVRVNPLDVVAMPSKYLNKYVTIRGKFDKFSTLGLDYEPAMRSSENYITFLIQRENANGYEIPLSEMKVFLKRAEAEKHIDLSAGDEIEFSGKVFSTALGDVWVDADKFVIISQKKKEANKK